MIEQRAEQDNRSENTQNHHNKSPLLVGGLTTCDDMVVVDVKHLAMCLQYNYNKAHIVAVLSALQVKKSWS